MFLSENTNNTWKARDCFSNFLSTSNIGVPSLKTVRYYNRVVFIPNKWLEVSRVRSYHVLAIFASKFNNKVSSSLRS